MRKTLSSNQHFCYFVFRSTAHVRVYPTVICFLLSLILPYCFFFHLAHYYRHFYERRSSTTVQLPRFPLDFHQHHLPETCFYLSCFFFLLQKRNQKPDIHARNIQKTCTKWFVGFEYKIESWLFDCRLDNILSASILEKLREIRVTWVGSADLNELKFSLVPETWWRDPIGMLWSVSKHFTNSIEFRKPNMLVTFFPLKRPAMALVYVCHFALSRKFAVIVLCWLLIEPFPNRERPQISGFIRFLTLRLLTGT